MISGNAESVLGVLAMYIQAQGESALTRRSLQGMVLTNRLDRADHDGYIRNTIELAGCRRDHPFPSRPNPIVRYRVLIPFL